MIGWAGDWLGGNCGHDQMNSAPTGNSACAHHQLDPVGSADIGEKTGICGGGVLQFGNTTPGFRGEGPVKAQWF